MESRLSELLGKAPTCLTRLMIGNALEGRAQVLLEEGTAFPVPSETVQSPDADVVELVPLSVHAATSPR